MAANGAKGVHFFVEKASVVDGGVIVHINGPFMATVVASDEGELFTRHSV